MNPDSVHLEIIQNTEFDYLFFKREIVSLKREVDGLLLLNKPLGLSSNQALQRVKHLYHARKAGHSGSLDPLATGLLPICFGKTTKLAKYLLEEDKQYRVECLLGVTTTTGDAEGDVIATESTAGITLSQIELALAHFRGEIEQIPPMYSALKHQGQPLYRLARQGLTVPRLPRTVTIHAITLISLEQSHLTLQIHCSKGTYIRTLAEDLGQYLGCGASVSALHRGAVGRYEEMIALATLEQTAELGLSALDMLLIR